MNEKSYKYIHDIKITIPKYLLIIEGSLSVAVVQSLSLVQLFATP